VLSKTLCLPLVNPAGSQGFLFLLTPTAQRLELRPADRRLYGAIYADLANPDISRRIRGGRRQPLARACGLHKQAHVKLLDATAGLGRDGVVLAGLGCRVSLFERSPLIAALLNDALTRAAGTAWVQERVSLTCGDARNYMQSPPSTERHDVVYLDPMYPHREKTALPSKEMRAIRAIVGDDGDTELLLETALAYATRRVVVKRPSWAAPLAGRQPDHEVNGKLARYDVYFTASQPAAP
jgi:16S rRNA (guanine1516-N2)-methyltransferase